MIKRLAVAAVAVAVLAGCATSGHAVRPAGRASHAGQAQLTSRQSTATVRHVFRAYDASGRLTVPVAHRAKGSCFTGSLAAPGAGSYRCIAGNEILDPCFARSGADTVPVTLACVADPWSKATALTVAKPLPSGASGARIWAFRRADGARCVAATGTVPAVHGRNLPYDCTDGTFAALVGPHARHVQSVFAKAGAATLRHAAVPAVWSA